MSDFLNRFEKSKYQKGSSINDVTTGEEAREYDEAEYGEAVSSQDDHEYDEVEYTEEDHEFDDLEYADDSIDVDGGQDSFQGDEELRNSLEALLSRMPDSSSFADDSPILEGSLYSSTNLHDDEYNLDDDQSIYDEEAFEIQEVQLDEEVQEMLNQIDATNYEREAPVNTRNSSNSQGQGRIPVPQRGTASRGNRNEQQSSKAKITAPEHVVVKDTSHHKRKIVRYIVALLGIVAIAFVALFIFNTTNQVEVPDFTEGTLADFRGWELTNRVTIEPTHVFDLEHDEGIIISQDTPSGTIIRRGGVVRVTVSRGPDPDELIELPDFHAMTTADVRAWRTEVRALNVSINEEYHDDVPAGRFIRKEFVDSAVTAATYTRKDGLLIFMSRGAEVLPENITVPNFVGRTKAEANEWAEEHTIIVTFEEDTSDTVAADLIISQSIEPRTRIARYTEMTIVISLGPSVTVPNFRNMIEEEAIQFPGFEFVVQHRYHATINFGRLISQSVPAGEELIGELPQITLVYSLGQPFLEDLSGSNVGILAERFHLFTSRGANITYTIIHVNSWYPRGQILEVSRGGEHLNMTDHVYFWVSLENLWPPDEANNGGME